MSDSLRMGLKVLTTYLPTSALDSFRKRNVQAERRRAFWEVDALRGIAIVLMVIYHFVYDLYFFQITDAIFTNPFWFYFQRVDASTFILLVGVSLSISYTRAVKKEGTSRALAGKFMQRGCVSSSGAWY